MECGLWKYLEESSFGFIVCLRDREVKSRVFSNITDTNYVSFSSASNGAIRRESSRPEQSRLRAEGRDEEAPRLRGVRSDPSFVSDPIVEFVRS